jgi:hypothetical protein
MMCNSEALPENIGHLRESVAGRSLGKARSRPHGARNGAAADYGGPLAT